MSHMLNKEQNNIAFGLCMAGAGAMLVKAVDNYQQVSSATFAFYATSSIALTLGLVFLVKVSKR